MVASWSAGRAESTRGVDPKATAGFASPSNPVLWDFGPAAPYEAALLVESFLGNRGVRDRSEIHLYTPEHQPMPVAEAALGEAIAEMLRDRSIHFHPLFTFEKMRHFARRERSHEAHTYPPFEAERLDHLAHAAQRAVINGWRTGLGPRELREGPEHHRDRCSRGVCFPDSTPLIRSPFLTTLRAVPLSSISPYPTETSLTGR